MQGFELLDDFMDYVVVSLNFCIFNIYIHICMVLKVLLLNCFFQSMCLYLLCIHICA